jgi:DNA-binding LytR/AlgR family response regulator
VLLHTRDEEIRLRMTVSELEETLGEGFCRPSRSFIVGLAHISRITKTDVVLDSGASVPLGKGMYDSVNLALIKYLREN